MNPKMLTERQFNGKVYTDENQFIKYHKLKKEFNWDKVLGEDWRIVTEKEHYERYKKWFTARFTKLGRALS